MKNTKFPKKHHFSERPKSVTTSQSRQRSVSPNAKMSNYRENINMYSPSSKKSNISNNNTPHNNQNFIGNLNMNDLIFNVNDDHKTLINKNRKLSNLLIQASNKIADIVNYF